MTDFDVEDLEELTRRQYESPALEYDYDPTYYDPSDTDEELDRLRPGGNEEQTTWGYLGLLGVLFVLLVGFAWACNERGESGLTATQAVEEERESAALTPVRLTIDIAGDTVTVRGSVPDDGARSQIIATTEAVYDSANLIDELTVDPATTLEDGSVSVSGVALEDDDRPDRLRNALVDDLALTDGGLTIERSEVAAAVPVTVDVVVDGSSVVLSGAVPDEDSITQLIEAATAVWGGGAVDGSGLTVGDRSWTNGRVRLTGTVPGGDERYLGLEAEVQSRLGALISVESAGLQQVDSTETLNELEEQIKAALEESPILFDPQSSEIQSASDEVLETIAAILQAAPANAIEVVGHTDDLGPDDENLLLSQERAEAVVARLVELGVDESLLNARGEGERFPLVENDSDENRALNRRIEFLLIQ